MPGGGSGSPRTARWSRSRNGRTRITRDAWPMQETRATYSRRLSPSRTRGACARRRPSSSKPHPGRTPPRPHGLPALLLRMQNQLLHAPVEQLRDIKHVLRRAGDLVDPAELLQLLAGFAEHAEHLSVQGQLEHAAGERV